MTTTPKNIGFVAYPLQVIFLSTSSRRNGLLIDHESLLVGLLPVRFTLEQVEKEEIVENEQTSVYRITTSTTVPLRRKVRVTAD